jgi:DNA-binding protein H-NS
MGDFLLTIAGAEWCHGCHSNPCAAGVYSTAHDPHWSIPMAIDLKTLNHNQLLDLIEKAKNRQGELAKEKISDLRTRVEQMVKKEGFSMDDVFPARGGRRGRKLGSVAPKFRNPGNPGQTWSGRGKRPRWFVEALAAGKKEKDLLIK